MNRIPIALVDGSDGRGRGIEREREILRGRWREGKGEVREMGRGERK